LPGARALLLLLLLCVVAGVHGYDGSVEGYESGGGGHSSYDEYQNEPSRVIAYKYVIDVGFIAVIAALVPLHALLSQKGRLMWHSIALLSTLVSATAAIVGATFNAGRLDQNGYMWRTIPTAIFMIMLALLIQIQVVGGWHILRHHARARTRVILATVSDRQWREDISVEDYTRLVAASSLGNNILRFSAEPDQDAAVVAVLPIMRRWEAASTPGSGEFDGVVGGDEVVCSDTDPYGRVNRRHEPVGVVFLGSVRYSELWLEELLTAIRRQPRAVLAMLHHICIFIWLAGMVFGALSKTGYNAPANGTVHLSPGVVRLREVGMWIQAVLLVIGIYAFPYTRSIARYGTRIWPRMVLLLAQTAVSIGIGVAMVATIRESKSNQNLIAFAIALVLCSTACAAWCLVSVNAYQQAIRILLARNPLRNQKATAFIAAIVTRPRHGYRGNVPVLCWGDRDQKGHAALEVLLEHEIEVPINDGIEERILDNAAGAEWRLLESAAKSNF
jgi:hypothetical protein